MLSVHEEPERMSSSLLLRMGVLKALGRGSGADGDGSFAREVKLFLATLANVRGRPYFRCTHGLLFAFYGQLTTYLSILIQSV